MNRKRMIRKYKTFALKFLIACSFIFAVGTIALQSLHHEVYHKVQVCQKEISTLEAEIDDLTMQKEELVSFDRLNDVAKSNGYTYHTVSTAAIIEVESK